MVHVDWRVHCVACVHASALETAGWVTDWRYREVLCSSFCLLRKERISAHAAVSRCTGLSRS